MPLIFRKTGGGSSGSGGVSVPILPNADTLSKFSMTPTGELVFDGKVIGGETTQTFENAETLGKFSENENGELVFNGKIVGSGNENNTSKALEVTHYVTLQKNQKFIELPGDCDISQAIVLTLNGIVINQGDFWTVIEKTYPEKDLISWEGLELETLAQEGDSVLITYYKKC